MFQWALENGKGVILKNVQLSNKSDITVIIPQPEDKFSKTSGLFYTKTSRQMMLNEIKNHKKPTYSVQAICPVMLCLISTYSVQAICPVMLILISTYSVQAICPVMLCLISQNWTGPDHHHHLKHVKYFDEFVLHVHVQMCMYHDYWHKVWEPWWFMYIYNMYHLHHFD